ncbi:metallophosphoesterase family protein [Aliagarivorans marinus]|uniref:metallophosphoesterase family protein n=1 Tax=Aliagarivorans marinus TaxID=561965 RepID=UPI000400DDE6|nr:metallophosphoesterase [Aliagarivorans marinus]
MTFKKTALAVLTSMALAACNSSSNSEDGGRELPELTQVKIGILTDTQGGGDAVALPQMEAILDLYSEQGINYVIAVGDLTNSNTEHEYEDWKAMAQRYPDITFLPLMGNHDRKPGDNYTWARIMSEFIPQENVVHMPQRKYQTYAYTTGNILMVQISDQDKPYAFEWVKEQIEGRDASIEHVFVSSHSPFVGPYRGGITYENLVARWNNQLENDLFTADFEGWRDLLIDNDVIYLSGHDHQYSRSVIWGQGAGNGSASFDEEAMDDYTGNRFFHHIVTGNASDKSYYLRIGEFEKIQDMLMFRTTTPGGRAPGDEREWTEEEIARDAQGPGVTQINASWFDITGSELTFQAYYDDWVSPSDVADGGADWKLFDRFTRSGRRCDKVVHPTSIAEASTYYSVKDDNYRTVWCHSKSGDEARLVDGYNQVFNRVDQALYGAEWLSSSLADLGYLERLSRYMKMSSKLGDNTIGSDRDFVVDGRNAINESHGKAYDVTPNIIGGGVGIKWYPHTVDMKKLVSLSWLPKQTETLSDVLVVSGIQGQTGIYSNPYGRMLDITRDEGRPGTGVEDNPADRRNLIPQNKPALDYVDVLDAKSPNRLDALNQDMALSSDKRHGEVRADDYVLEFKLPAGVAAEQAQLAYLDNGEWLPVLDNPECQSSMAYDSEFLNRMPEDIADLGCDSTIVVSQAAGGFWAKLDFEGQFAIIAK